MLAFDTMYWNSEILDITPTEVGGHRLQWSASAASGVQNYDASKMRDDRQSPTACAWRSTRHCRPARTGLTVHCRAAQANVPRFR
jgi:hypothetical protein